MPRVATAAVLALDRQRAMLDFEDGLVEEAESTLDGVIESLRATGGAEYELGRALQDRATVLTFSNRWRDALTDLDECERVASSLKEVYSRSLLVNVYQHRVKLLANPRAPRASLDAARRDLDRLARMGVEKWWVDIAAGDLAYQSKDWQHAAVLYRATAAKLENEGWTRGVAACRLRAGRSAFEAGDLVQAEKEIESALSHFLESGPADLLAAARIAKARWIAAARGDLEAAWELSEAGLSAIERSIRKFRSIFEQQRFMLDKLELFEQVFAIGLSAPGTTGVWRAWQIAERAKSGYLRQLAANAGVDLLEGVDPDLKIRLKEVEEELDRQERAAPAQPADMPRWESEIARLSERKERLLGELMKANPRWASLHAPVTVDLERIVGNLPEGWSVMSFFWHRGNLTVFMGSPGDQASATTAGWAQSEMDDLARALRELRATTGPAAARISEPIPLELTRKILPPDVESWLQGKRRVLISPHGPLKSLPLHWARLSSGRRLIEDTAVQYVPTLGLLDLDSGSRPKASERILLLGCRKDGHGSGELVDAPLEINALRAIWSMPPGREVVAEHLAPDSTFGPRFPPPERWQDFSVIHVACHGKFNENRPLDAALLLGGEQVRAWKWLSARLNADVVCFSACDLGQHSVLPEATDAAGDEWLGLCLPTLYAGSRTILISSWQANSKEAVRMMEAFHRGLADGQIPADAFRQAVMAGLNRRPAFWANWYLAGMPD